MGYHQTSDQLILVTLVFLTVIWLTNGQESTDITISCKVPNVNNGKWDQKTMTLRCNPGYKPSSNSSYSCVNNTWDPKPQCKGVKDKGSNLAPLIAVLCVVAVIIIIVLITVPYCRDRKVYSMMERELYNWEGRFRGANDQRQRMFTSIQKFIEDGKPEEKAPLSESSGDNLLTDEGHVKVATASWIEKSLRLERSPGWCPCWWTRTKREVLAHQLLYLTEVAVNVHKCKDKGVYRLATLEQRGETSPAGSKKSEDGGTECVPVITESWTHICDSRGPCGIVLLPEKCDSIKLYIRKDTVTPSQYQPKFMEVHFHCPVSGSWTRVGVVNVNATHSPLTVPNMSVSIDIYPQVKTLDNVSAV